MKPTAGYSGTPLIQKLGIKPGHRVLFVNPPRDLNDTLGSLPEDVVELKSGSKNLNVILLFTRSLADLKKQFRSLAKKLVANGSLWVCWLKKASGVTTDVNENLVRAHGLEVGLVDVKICAIDNTWSGLKFVIRLADRK
jgi:hypothetical protein